MKKNISKTIDILLIIGASTLIGINSFTLIKNKEIVKALNFENYKIENENITLDEKQESLNLSNQVDFLNKELKFFNCNIFFNEKGFYIKDSLLKIKGISPIYLYLREDRKSVV